MACGRGSPAPATSTPWRAGALARSNVLLVTIDTLRADRVGAYSGGPLTPTIDRLAATGVRFAQARAHAPMTLPAHTSVLTGLLPASHGVHTNGLTVLAAGTPTLATVLHDAGYRTAAFVGAFVLDARFGLSRGFDRYDDRVGSDGGAVTFEYAERPADRVVAAAGDWILAGSSTGREPQGRPAPWFCWVHLFDPHAPYRAPERRFENPYDNEVAFADRQLGVMLDRLRAAGQLASTLVVVLGDHGESLGEHGEATHGLFAYDATLRIPLIVSASSAAASVSDAPAGQVDVAPTILDLLGISAPPAVDGRSLVAAMRGEAVADRPVFFEALDANLSRNWAPLTGVVAGGWKYIELPDAELYDLARDAGELQNRIREQNDRAARLARTLRDLRPAATAGARPAPLDPDAAARLRSLGYTATEAPARANRQYTSADDPKRLVEIDRAFQRALTLTGERDYRTAAALLERVIAERGDFTAAYLTLASVFIQAGEPSRAVALLDGAVKRGVAAPEVRARLGAAYLAAGDLRRAATVLAPVADTRTPGGLDASNTLGVVLTQLGERDRARRLFSSVLAQSPHAAGTWLNVGLLEMADNCAGDAAHAFEAAVGADPDLAQAWAGLGAARAGTDPDGAIEAWKRAVALDPRNYDVLFNVAALLRERGRIAEARPYIERFVREAPRDRYARDVETLRAWLK